MPAGTAFSARLADNAFDRNAVHASTAKRAEVAVIPSRADRSVAIPHEAERHGRRHLVGNVFWKIKAFRRIAARYDETGTSFAAANRPVAIVLAAR